MSKSGVVLLICMAFYPILSQAQSLQVLDTHGRTSFRGLSTPGKDIAWVSGSGGTVGRSTDGGAHWKWMTVPGQEKRDFRDIEAFDSVTALIMAVDTPAAILKTTDGGKTWKEVFRDNTPGMFLDAMGFYPKYDDESINARRGIVVGDPVPTQNGNRFFLAVTKNAGDSWTVLPAENRPRADSAEGCFASSGTNIDCSDQFTFWSNYAFVSGGPASRLFTGGDGERLPVLQGRTSTGANSIAIDKDHWIIVGGDFARDTVVAGNCIYSTDGGKHWLTPKTPPHGYRSCVVHLWDNTWLCCGTSGIDITKDGGDHWTLISKESFHVAAYPGAGKTVYLAGSKGRVAQLLL